MGEARGRAPNPDDERSEEERGLCVRRRSDAQEGISKSSYFFQYLADQTGQSLQLQAAAHFKSWLLYIFFIFLKFLKQLHISGAYHL